MATINFYSEEIDFKIPNNRKVSSWIKSTVEKEKRKIKELNYIFCSDEYLTGINIQFLNHTTYTDIITFDNTEMPGFIEGDIYISIERVKENATKFKTDFIDELHRVIIHGVLHLLGYSDKSSIDKRIMRDKENTYLSLRD
jgi:probable rRNA maturation factor